MGRVAAAGTQLVLDGAPWRLHGVSYGTFARRADGVALPETDRMKRDFVAMAEAGFTAVRTYEVPSDDLLDLAADWGLRVLAGVHYDDWRYLVGASGRQRRRAAAEARRQVARAAHRLAEDERVAALVLGNELPADVVRWVGPDRVADLLASLADTVAEVDPGMLRTYGNYPTTEHLDLGALDLLLFNVFLEDPADLRRYVARLQNLADGRPLVLGELGLSTGGTAAGERRQADLVAASLAVAAERGVAGTCLFSWTDDWWVGGSPVEGWHFGLTRADRTPRPALAAAAAAAPVAERCVPAGGWPSLSVVVCAHDAAATLDECLTHTCRLDYPGLEVLVVDDGSTDATAAIVAAHPRARLVSIPHAGLSAARNVGLAEARGELVAYLDADAYPTPDWPYHLALGFDAPEVVGVGGPNLGPAGDGPVAAAVALAPGGPVHVLTADDRAEHLPGCNMAFRRHALAAAGGFDPVFTAAGDDVDLCWRLLDRGGDLAFHAGALVWHHRRASVRGYLRQQRGYGRSEALVEVRHPERFTVLGTARWAGSIYGGPRRLRAQRIYQGPFGTAPFQPRHGRPDHSVELATQVGAPLSAALVATAPVGAVGLVAGLPVLALPALVGLVVLAGLVVANTPGRRVPAARRLDRRHRLLVGVLSVLQPLARLQGRSQASRALAAPAGGTDGARPVARAGRSVLLYPADGDRVALVAAVMARLRRAGRRVRPATAWDAADAIVAAGPLAVVDLVTSAQPTDCIQLRLRARVRTARAAVVAAAAAVLWLITPAAGLAAVAVVAVLAGQAVWSAGPGLRRILEGEEAR